MDTTTNTPAQPGHANPVIATIEAQLNTLSAADQRAYLEMLPPLVEKMQQALQLIDTLPNAKDRAAVRASLGRAPFEDWLPWAQFWVRYDTDRRQRRKA